MAVGIEIEGAGTVRVEPGPVSAVLDQQRVPADITHVTVVADDGYRASIPFETLNSGGVLSIEDNAWRLKVVDGHTLCWNVKGVVRLEPTIGKAKDDIPDNPTH